MENNPQPVSPNLLRRYFSSGWAFFMPYLFFYLLYYWRKWPVNPLPPDNLASGSHIPPLLHIYWALHAIHLVLGLIALRAWRQNSLLSTSLSSVALAKEDRLSTLNPQPSVFQPFSFSAFLPWLLLALIFCIPGAYLEWPSDPWEHLRRIVDCANDQTLTLYKYSGYFLAGSFLDKVSANHQLLWLNIYYTGICLLLSWQYYRLARATGLGVRASVIFIILQSLLFGNNVFSFYRYYGISSSIYAQLGAIALTRLGIEFAQQMPASPVRWLKTLGCAVLLALLTAVNHVQGLGIAAICLAAIAAWRLIAWKRSMLWWLATVALALSVAAMHWWPHHHSLDRIYRPSGWFTAWDGFNVLSPHSPAGDRMLQIIGILGVINLSAGLLLLCCNHVAGWLTVMPVLVLSLPFAAIPFAGALFAGGGVNGIIAFHRMLFAIPSGLACVCLGEKLAQLKAENSFIVRALSSVFQRSFFGISVLAILALTTIPASGPFYNKTWHALMKAPYDLTMQVAWSDCDGYLHSQSYQPHARIAGTSAMCEILDIQKPMTIVCAGRTLYYSDDRSPANDMEIIRAWLNYGGALTTLVPSTTMIYTPYSFAALCSHHWLPQEVALAFTGTTEIHAMVSSSGPHTVSSFGQMLYYQTGK
jgi:hypothetical protein